MARAPAPRQRHHQGRAASRQRHQPAPAAPPRGLQAQGRRASFIQVTLTPPTASFTATAMNEQTSLSDDLFLLARNF